MRIAHMTVDHAAGNLCVGERRPVFAWRLDDGGGNLRQESCRIRVFDESGRTVWDSGSLASSRMGGWRYAGEPLRSDSRYRWRAELGLDRAGKKLSASGESFFETGLFDREDWQGEFLGETADGVYHVFRKTIVLEQIPRRAKIYVCGLGHFELWVNGVRATDHVLEPGWSDYRKTCFYTAISLEPLLREGENVLLFKLGDGMFHVPGGRYVYYPRSYGRSRVLARLALTAPDGTRSAVVTDGSWRQSPSPVRFCCIYGGEDYDARLWRPEALVPGIPDEAFGEPAAVVGWPEGELRAMPMEPVRVGRVYEPVSVEETSPGVWLYDLGANFSGRARIRLRTGGTMAGQSVTLAPRELREKGERRAWESYAWTYILSAEDEQEFAPDFTYTGFRYVEVTGAVPAGRSGAPGLPELCSLTGEFLWTDAEKAGEFSCSNELFNRIHAIVLQAILSNTKSYFTDCPHREKLGWLEQTHLIGPSILYNLDARRLYGKIEGDMRDAQHGDGLVPDICPEYVTGFDRWHKGFLDSPEWGSALVLNPWMIYRRYGDPSLLEEYYPAMKKYVDYLAGKTHHEILHHGLGDWLDVGPCTPHSQNTPVPVVATCVYYLDLTVMKKTAELLGKTKDAADFSARMERVYREYNLQFLDDQTGRYATGSQAAQAMSLVAGLVPPEFESRVVRELRADVEKRGYALTAGDVGHPFFIAACKQFGLSDLVNRMTNITETPGYGYQVKCGATSLTEEWDGPDPARPHGSQNHLMLGSIEEWFYGALAGIELVRCDLPFGEIRIAPQPQEGVDWVKAWTMHPYGKISVSWQREGGEVVADVIVPPNVTAHLIRADGREAAAVGSGHHRYTL